MEPNETFIFEANQPEANGSSISLHAGFPNPSEQAKPLSLDFNQLLVRHPSSTFVFRLRGPAWQRFGIWDYDLVVVDRTATARTNDLAVWFRAGEIGFGLSRSKAVPINATVWGKVTAIIHQYR